MVAANRIEQVMRLDAHGAAHFAPIGRVSAFSVARARFVLLREARRKPQSAKDHFGSWIEVLAPDSND